jgi:hypothetical protein
VRRSVLCSWPSACAVARHLRATALIPVLGVATVGIVDAGEWSDRQALVASATAQVGVPVPVEASTFGCSSCTEPDSSVVRVEGLVADITLHDRYVPRERTCAADVRAFPRSLVVTFRQAGEATIRLHGRNTHGPITLSRTLVVEA